MQTCVTSPSRRKTELGLGRGSTKRDLGLRLYPCCSLQILGAGPLPARILCRVSTSVKGPALYAVGDPLGSEKERDEPQLGRCDVRICSLTSLSLGKVESKHKDPTSRLPKQEEVPSKPTNMGF